MICSTARRSFFRTSSLATDILCNLIEFKIIAWMGYEIESDQTDRYDQSMYNEWDSDLNRLKTSFLLIFLLLLLLSFLLFLLI